MIGKTGTYTYDPSEKIAGLSDVIRGEGTLDQEQDIKVLQVLKKVGGKHLAIEAADDGSLADALSIVDISTGTGETKPFPIYLAGEFVMAEVVVPDTKTAADYKDALRAKGIILK